MTLESILEEVEEERERQLKWGSDSFDKSNTHNDWIAYIVSYAGDAAAKVRKKESKTDDLYEENEYYRYRSNMIKVAALAVAAVQWLED